MVHFARYDSPFGPIQIGYENGFVQSIQCCETEFPHAPSTVSDLAASQLREYFAGSRKTFDFPCELRGTSFQLAVWEALRRIPYGQTRTYGQIAAAIGRPKASRAVGMACHRNPLWIVVPCHRVVGSSGALTGYAGGLSMKRMLLGMEQTSQLP